MAKGIAIGVNIIFLASGIVLGIVGGVFAYRTEQVFNEVELLSFLPVVEVGIALLVVGVLLSLLACIGIMGVLAENKKLVSCYIFTLLIIVIAMIVVTIVAIVFSTRVSELVDDNIGAVWADSSEDTRLGIQNELNCCGFSSNDDNPAGGCTEGDTCRDAAIQFLENNIIPIAGVAGGLGVLLLCALCSVMCVRSSLGNKEYEDRWTA